MSEMSKREQLPVGFPICYNPYSEPRRLECGHAFCTDCLLDNIRANVQHGQFKCHVCKRTLQAPREITSNKQFRRMFPLATEFIEGAAKHQPMDEAPECEIKGHKKELSRYCINHKQCICSVCEQSHHKKCNVTDVSVQAKSLHAEILALSDRVRSLDQVMSEESRKAGETGKKSLADLQMMRERVKDHTERKVKKLREQEKVLLADISHIENEIKMKARSLEETKQETGDALQEINSAKHEENNWNKIKNLESIKQWWERQISKEIATFTWNCNIKTEQKQSEDKRVARMLVDRKHKARRRTVATSEQTWVGGVVMKDIKLECMQDIVGVTTVNNMVLTMHEGDPHIWGYKKCGLYIKKVRVPKLQYPAGHGTIIHIPGEDSMCVCVTDYCGCSMHLLTLSENVEIRNQQIIDLGYEPWSVSLSRGSELVVCETDSNKVRTYDRQGHLVHQYDNLCTPICAIKLTTGEYVTTDCNDSIVWSDSEGHKLHEYKNKDSPHCLTEDMNGNILVIYSHGVMLFDPCGSFIKNILSDGSVVSPDCLHLDEGGCLHVPNNPDYGDKTLKVIQTVEDKSCDQLSIKETNISATLTLFD